MEDKTKTDNISDVARPGQTAASPTSKPIITGHSLMTADPILQPKAGDPLLEEKDKNSPQVSKQKVLKPSEGFKPQPEAQPAPSKTAIPDQSSVTQANPPTSAEELARQEHLNKLVADKTYFLPIRSVAKRRGNNIAIIILGLVIVFASVAFYLMNK